MGNNILEGGVGWWWVGGGWVFFLFFLRRVGSLVERIGFGFCVRGADWFRMTRRAQVPPQRRFSLFFSLFSLFLCVCVCVCVFGPSIGSANEKLENKNLAGFISSEEFVSFYRTVECFCNGICSFILGCFFCSLPKDSSEGDFDG